MTKQPGTIKDWLAFADEDLRAAQVLFEEGIHNQACFHGQQCVEKLLKAILIDKQQSAPKIHDVKELYRLCIDAGVYGLMAWKTSIQTISLFYAPTRYPDAVVGSLPNHLPNKKDAQEALITAKTLLEAFDELLKAHPL